MRSMLLPETTVMASYLTSPVLARVYENPLNWCNPVNKVNVAECMSNSIRTCSFHGCIQEQEGRYFEVRMTKLSTLNFYNFN